MEPEITTGYRTRHTRVEGKKTEGVVPCTRLRQTSNRTITNTTEANKQVVDCTWGTPPAHRTNTNPHLAGHVSDELVEALLVDLKNKTQKTHGTQGTRQDIVVGRGEGGRFFVMGKARHAEHQPLERKSIRGARQGFRRRTTTTS